MITDRIGLQSVLLPLLITMIITMIMIIILETLRYSISVYGYG